MATANVATFLPGELRLAVSQRLGAVSSRMHVLEAAFSKHSLHAIGIQESRLQGDGRSRCGLYTIFRVGASEKELAYNPPTSSERRASGS